MNLPQHTVRELQYFVGKVCTIVVPVMSGNISIDNKRFVDFFVGRVDAIDDQCIWTSHLITGTKSVFFDVISINEEQVISPDHPDYDDLKSTFETKSSPVPQAPPTPFVDVSDLTARADQIKNQFK